MYVEKLDILNIRSYTNASLHFSKGINLLLGANNSGKSTILRCLQKLQEGLHGIEKEDVRKTASMGKIHVEISDIKSDDHFLFQPKLSSPYPFEDKQDILFVLNNQRGAKETEGAYQVNPGEGEFILEENNMGINSTVNDRQQSYLPFPKFPKMEDESNFIYPFLSKRKTSHYSARGGREEAYQIGEVLHNLPARIQNLTNGTHPFGEDYKTLCTDILGFPVGKISGASPEAGDKLGIFVRQNETIPLESMGEGVANILGLLTILLTDNNKLFLIEEIENDIHPEALKKLLQLIIDKSSSNQFIISTHSNIVLKHLASIPETKIFYTHGEMIRSEHSRITVPTSTICAIENAPVERIKILEKLGYDLFDFELFKSYLIFEESSAEGIVKNYLIPMFVPTLKSTMKTIAAKGVDDVHPRFIDFMRLFVFIHVTPLYHQKAWVIVDGDKAGKKSIAKLTKAFPAWKDNFLTLSKDDFEYYYPEQFRQKFPAIDAIEDEEAKQDAKKALLLELIAWMDENPEMAKSELSVSAKEVIDLLKHIDTIIN